MSTATENIDLSDWENWDPKSKEKFLKALENAQKVKKAWYCASPGRACDGMEHEGYPYRHARGDQWPPPPGDWLIWLLKGGRGSGKTRSGSEWIRNISKTHERVSIIGPTSFHVRGTMIEGDSGLLAVFENAGQEALWEPSKSRITVACQCKTDKPEPVHRLGHFIQAFTGEEPERLRGPQHAAVWLDEPAHFDKIEKVWSNMIFGLRLGTDPKILCSTTPLPTKWMKELVKRPDCVSVTVSTFANLANLAPTVRQSLKEYEGTRLGRQELYGEILEDIEGALWKTSMIDDFRFREDVHEIAKTMERIIVSIDPAGTSSKKRDETGIVVVGKLRNQFYVLADRSGHYTPDGWAKEAWKAFDEFEADLVVAEKNYGGEMVLSTLRNSRISGPVKLVHSRRGKVLRAEPIVSLYEQERVHHTLDLTELETQMTEWVPDMDDSPDRVDALVHGLTELSGGPGPASIAMPTGEFMPRGGAGAPSSKSLFGYQPREEPAPTVITRASLIDTLSKLMSPDLDCQHPRLFEHHEEAGVLVCGDCYANVDAE
ncbi:terminase [Arthrobacter phage Beagle]|nr:terminase [Arthrobacter phage Beagle]QOP66772.1 terminase [Arthrobacter phage Odyssey395]